MVFSEKKFIEVFTKKVERELNCKVTVTQEAEGLLTVRNENNGIIHQISKEFLSFFAKIDNLDAAIQASMELVALSLDMGQKPAHGERLKNIYPILKNADAMLSILTVYKDSGANLLYRESDFEGIYIVMVEDCNDMMAILTESVLEKLNVDEDELFEIALSNLKNKEIHPQIISIDGYNVTTIKSCDGYDASRILTLPFNELGKTAKGDLLVVVPERDMLVIFDSAEIVNTDNLFNWSLEQSNTRYSITPDIFRFKDGEFVEQIRGYVNSPLV